MRKGKIISIATTVVLAIGLFFLFQASGNHAPANETAQVDQEKKADKIIDESNSVAHTKDGAASAQEESEEAPEKGGQGENKSKNNKEKDEKAGIRRGDDEDKVGTTNSNNDADAKTSSQDTSKKPQNEKSSSNGQANGSTNEKDRKNKTVTSIKNDYFPQFQQLEWEQNGKIESLLQQAFDDYMNDSSSFNASTYRARAESLQASSDQAFYKLYKKMQRELSQNGHSKNAAAEFEQQYHSKKAAREQELREIVDGL